MKSKLFQVFIKLVLVLPGKSINQSTLVWEPEAYMLYFSRRGHSLID